MGRKKLKKLQDEMADLIAQGADVNFTDEKVSVGGGLSMRLKHMVGQV